MTLLAPSDVAISTLNLLGNNFFRQVKARQCTYLSNGICFTFSEVNSYDRRIKSCLIITQTDLNISISLFATAKGVIPGELLVMTANILPVAVNVQAAFTALTGLVIA